MEIIKSYPLIFLLTVLLPFAGGIVGAYLGWDALQSRVRDEKYQNTVEDQLNNISGEHNGVRNHFLGGSGTWRGRMWPGMVPDTFLRHVRDNSHVCWSTAGFDTYLAAVEKYWRDWDA